MKKDNKDAQPKTDYAIARRPGHTNSGRHSGDKGAGGSKAEGASGAGVDSFAARGIARRREPGPRAAKRRPTSTFGDTPIVETRARRVRVEKSVWGFGAALAVLLAAGVLIVSRAASPEPAAAVPTRPAQASIDPRVLDAVRDLAEGSHDERLDAIAYIGNNTRDSVVFEPLGELLFDPANDIRAEAAWALAMVGDGRATEALMAVATHDADETVRLKAMWALGELRSNQAAPLLVDALASRVTRATAANSLEKIGESAIQPLLARLAENGVDLGAEIDSIRAHLGNRTVGHLITNVRLAPDSSRHGPAYEGAPGEAS